jgi:hypothetical protein
MRALSVVTLNPFVHIGLQFIERVVELTPGTGGTAANLDPLALLHGRKSARRRRESLKNTYSPQSPKELRKFAETLQVFGSYTVRVEMHYIVSDITHSAQVPDENCSINRNV